MVDIITYAIIILGGIFSALLIAFPLRFLWKPVYSTILGLGGLMLANIVGMPFGIHIGINLLTVLICAILGVPGFTMLLLLSILL